MALLLTFLVFAVLGQSGNLLISIQVEQRVSEAAGLIGFFALFVVIFVVAWKLAVAVTGPAAAHHAARHG